MRDGPVRGPLITGQLTTLSVLSLPESLLDGLPDGHYNAAPKWWCLSKEGACVQW
jgi:hypothetical protein